MILMFVDDTKVSCKISNENDGALLQQDLEHLMEWSKDCHLDFNVEKCTIMTVKHSFRLSMNLMGESYRK